MTAKNSNKMQQTDNKNNANSMNLDDVISAIAKLKDELKLLNSHNFIKTQNSLLRLIRTQFLKGLAFGLGSAIGATLLVSFLVYLVSTIEFVPILGDWLNQIIQQIQMPSDS